MLEIDQIPSRPDPMEMISVQYMLDCHLLDYLGMSLQGIQPIVITFSGKDNRHTIVNRRDK